jgi:small conductance mechanosensitive channel
VAVSAEDFHPDLIRLAAAIDTSRLPHYFTRSITSIPRRQEGAMDLLHSLIQKLKQLHNPFSDDRFTANAIAVHGLIVVAIVACLILRHMLARGGHSLIQRTGWKWIEPVVQESMRHGRRLVLWLTVAASLVLVVAGLLYHRAGHDIRVDYQNWREDLSSEDWTRLAYHLGLVVGVLFGTWIGTRVLRRLRARIEKRVIERLGCVGNEELLTRCVARVTRYSMVALWFVAFHLIEWIEQPGRGFRHTLHLVTRMFIILVVAHVLPLMLKSISPNIASLGTRLLGRTRFHHYWVRLARLLPLGERCFQYAVYIQAGYVVVQMLDLLTFFRMFTAHPEDLPPALVKCIGIFFGTRVLIELIQVLLNQSFGLYSEDRLVNQKARTLVPLLNSLCQYVLYFGAGVMMMGELGMQTTPILAAASFLGLAVGLGAQNLVTDLVSGFFILFESQYLVGDYVQIGEARGIVEAVGIRLTQLRDGHGKLHIIPNGHIKGVVNYSKDYINAVVDVKAASGSDLEAIMRSMTEAGRRLRQNHHGVLAETQIHGLVELGASEMTIRAVTKVRPGTHETMENEYRRLLKQVFDEQAGGRASKIAA